MATNDEIKAAVDALDGKLSDHIVREEKELAALARAFPNDDPKAHRAAHEAMIEAKQAEAKFWAELRLDLAKKSLWGLLLIVLGLVMVGGLFSVASKLGVAAAVVKP